MSYCCKAFENELGNTIQKWNDNGFDSDIKGELRLGYHGREYQYWSSPISFCPFCGSRIDGA